MNPVQELQDAIRRQYTPTLIFGVGGRIGSGASFVAASLTEELKAFGYSVCKVKVTELVLNQDNIIEDWLSKGTDTNNERFEKNIESFAEFLKSFGLTPDNISERSKRVLILQRRGNLLRQKYDPAFLGACCIEHVSKQLRNEKALNGHQARRAFVIDSLKNPAEVRLLSSVFGNAFCMIGVVADDAVRKRRLGDQKHFTTQEFDAISEIDSGESNENGQQATETILTADYFFENNYDKETKIKAECARLLNLLFESSIETPRRDEYGMHLAFMAADKSACLSRQVGSAILGEDGSVLATGHNDVPQFGGGLYSTESKEDARCFAKSRLCHNDFEKTLLADEVVRILAKRVGDLTDKQLTQLRITLLRESRLRSLIEFSRAVHAEMDAIMTIARNARTGIVGSTMYVTTYPCHNCAKHIIDAGIHRVVYLEPYSKSLAQKLHGDALNNPLETPHPYKVKFDNYGGVSPRRYSEWFSKRSDRKKDGKLLPKSQYKDNMLPICAIDSVTLEGNLCAFANWFVQVHRLCSVPNVPTTQDTVVVEAIEKEGG
jgi:deoxycytidylate deaminase